MSGRFYLVYTKTINDGLVFGADILKIFITTVSPQEALYAKKGLAEKEELIQSKLKAAKEFLPLFSPRKDTLRAEIEKN